MCRCGRSYSYRSGLLQHRLHECGKEPAFACTICPYKSKLKYNLRRHVLVKHSRLTTLGWDFAELVYLPLLNSFFLFFTKPHNYLLSITLMDKVVSLLEAPFTSKLLRIKYFIPESTAKSYVRTARFFKVFTEIGRRWRINKLFLVLYIHIKFVSPKPH